VERLTGIGVSGGVAWGPAALLLQHPLALRHSITRERVARETARLEAARDASRRQLREIRTRVTRSGGVELGQLFEVQILMLDDPLLVLRAASIIAEDRVNAEWAVERAFEEFAAVFRDVEDPYLRERHGDVADVVGRLSMNLRSGRSLARDWLLDLDQPSILIADDLAPSVAGQLDPRLVIALVVGTGSRTYHTSIVARSLKIPAVVGLGAACAHIKPGVNLVVDGASGEVIVDPPDELLREMRVRSEVRSARARQVTPPDTAAATPVTTLDGVRIGLEANIELPDDLAFARVQGASGVGLFRSEFLLGGQSTGAFSEDAQYAAYRDILERMAPCPVSIRTFDLDEVQAAGSNGQADQLAGVDGGLSRGPLGLRGIRLSLSQPEPFRTQMRALARAARHGTLRILFPFVSSVDELREARSMLRSVLEELGEPGTLRPEIAVGVMIEVPSAALTADLLAEEADFFSIGTNDLIQYCLAVDRTDIRVARSYEPMHPAILRMIRHVVRAAGRRGRPVSVCGEMASDPLALLLLIGLGVREFSMYPAAIPRARQLVRSVGAADLRRAAVGALRMHTTREVEAFAARALGQALIPADVTASAAGDQGEHRER
jgi:phosphotransferase system enzyme I (PtsI)